ncbi:MAG: Ig-like domain-containing protein [archaeon]
MFFGVKFEKIGLVFLVLLAIGVFSYAAYTTLIPSPGHGGGKIYVDINGNVILLQDAIDQNKLMGNYLKGTQLNSTHPSIEIGHFGTNVLVRVSGSDQNLQAAINKGTLCSNTPASAYTSPAPNPGHYASSILIRSPKRIEETLQNAIDSNEFCTCGNSICENGLNGNADYNENCSNCNSDCGNCTSCTSEPDTNFCNRNNAHCEYFRGLDNCEIDRNVNCGTCTLPQTCGGSGILNQCGCTPQCPIGSCGNQPNGCGGTIYCGPCSSSTCDLNVLMDDTNYALNYAVGFLTSRMIIVNNSGTNFSGYNNAKILVEKPLGIWQQLGTTSTPIDTDYMWYITDSISCKDANGDLFWYSATSRKIGGYCHKVTVMGVPTSSDYHISFDNPNYEVLKSNFAGWKTVDNLMQPFFTINLPALTNGQSTTTNPIMWIVSKAIDKIPQNRFKAKIICDLNPINSSPVFYDFNLAATINSPTKNEGLSKYVIDENLSTVNYSIVSQNASKVTCSISDKNLLYTPFTNYTGIASCIVRATDSGGLTDDANVKICVAETDAQLCVGHCGSNYPITDSCGVTRNINCPNNCTPGATCNISHVCVCAPNGSYHGGSCYLINVGWNGCDAATGTSVCSYNGSCLQTLTRLCTTAGYTGVSVNIVNNFPSGYWTCVC